MNSEKPNFLSQPVVKNIFMYRNGDPYYEARRLVINQKRVSNFETFLREVTGGVQPPFGAVRNIYTPRAGHRVDSLEHLQSGEQYVAAGREKFKKLDYQQIGSRKKRLLQTVSGQVKPVPQSRIIVSARFLKPIKEPCAIFVVANGDVLNPAARLLVPQRVLGQYERVLEMVTEKIGLRILGGVRSLYTFDGTLVNDGKDLESGQFYVAVGRERLKRLPYSDLLFTKPRGIRRIIGSKAASLPPIYRFSKQNGTTKSTAGCSETSAPSQGVNKEHLSSIVREISQARLMSLRKKRSRLSMSLGVPDNGVGTVEADQSTDQGGGETGDTVLQDEPAEEVKHKPAEDSKQPDPEEPPEEGGVKEGEEPPEEGGAKEGEEPPEEGGAKEGEEVPEEGGEKEGKDPPEEGGVKEGKDPPEDGGAKEGDDPPEDGGAKEGDEVPEKEAEEATSSTEAATDAGEKSQAEGTDRASEEPEGTDQASGEPEEPVCGKTEAGGEEEEEVKEEEEEEPGNSDGAEKTVNGNGAGGERDGAEEQGGGKEAGDEAGSRAGSDRKEGSGEEGGGEEARAVNGEREERESEEEEEEKENKAASSKDAKAGESGRRRRSGGWRPEERDGGRKNDKQEAEKAGTEKGDGEKKKDEKR